MITLKRFAKKLTFLLKRLMPAAVLSYVRLDYQFASCKPPVVENPEINVGFAPGEVLGQQLAGYRSEHEAMAGVTRGVVEIFHVRLADYRGTVRRHVVQPGPVAYYSDILRDRQHMRQYLGHPADELPCPAKLKILRVALRALSADYGTVRPLLDIVIAREAH